MSPSWLLFTWLCLLALPGISASSPERWLKRCTFLDRDRRFFMQWGNGDQEDIYIKLTVRTLGYVALGFSRRGTMVNSDIVIGWVADDQVYLQDRYSEGNQMPELDHKQDYELIYGSENNTHTTLFFKRKWNTCDPQDFTLEYGNTIRVMHSFSFEDPLDEINIPYHGDSNRGWRSMLLLQPEIPKETNVEYWDMLTDDFTVSPEWHTMYWCKLFKIPNWGAKHHVTTIEPVFMGGHQGGFVHHIDIYECALPKAQEYERYLGAEGYDCLAPDSPSFTRECDGFYTIWGVGAEGVVLPEHIGLPLVPGKYIMLQVHFDNFNRVIGTPGRSGIRYHHTPHLRQYDGGMLTVGVDITANVMAPPGLQDFLVAGHSNSECIDPVLPPEGVKMTSAILHSHLVGSRVKSRQFRNGIELPTLVDNKHYDQQYQQISIFPEERLLLPGDQLTTECTYDSTNRTRTTLGGFSTREEMCNAFIVYYPRFEGVYGSRSVPPMSTAIKYLGSKDLEKLTAGHEDYDQTFADFMTDYDWNKTAIRRLENGIRYAEHDSFCYRGTGFTDVKSMSSYPKGVKEYVEQPPCSKRRTNQRLREKNTRNFRNEKPYP